MAQNLTQFQKGLSLQQFLSDYGTEEQCEQALEHWRWPQGFVGPNCGHQHEPVRLRTRTLLQCRHCHHQASLTAGTIFADTKLSLTTWLLAMFLLTQQKNGISALELKRHLGVSYPTGKLERTTFFYRSSLASLGRSNLIRYVYVYVSIAPPSLTIVVPVR